MYRILLALTAVVALGVAPPPPAPLVMVFPLQTSTALDPAVNSQIVTLLENQIALNGNLRVQSGDPSVPRSNFLSEARKAGAQYYVTGFLTPLGSGASIIEQVVSTQTGVVIFANTGQLFSMSDAVGQGDMLRNGILERVAERGGFATFAPPATSGGANGSAGAPAVGATTAPEANVGGLFNHKRATAPAAAAPSPAPTDSPAP